MTRRTKEASKIVRRVSGGEAKRRMERVVSARLRGDLSAA